MKKAAMLRFLTSARSDKLKSVKAEGRDNGALSGMHTLSVHIHTCAHIHTLTHIYTHIYTHKHILDNRAASGMYILSVHTYTCIHALIHICIHTRTHWTTALPRHVNSLHTCVYMCTYTHTFERTQGRLAT